MSVPTIVRPPTSPQRPRGRAPYFIAVLAVFWLAAIVLPARVPDQSGSAYLGAGILATAGAAAGFLGASRLRARYATDRRTSLTATPLLALAIAGIVLGGLAYVLEGPSRVLSEAFAWTAELAALATVISLLPMTGSDGARVVHSLVARRRGEDAARRSDAVVAVRTGVVVALAGAVVLVTVDVGIGLAAMLLGYLGLTSGKVGLARQRLLASLDGRTAGEVVTPVTPLAGWRTLDDAMAGSWPAGVAGVPVVGWSGEPAGVVLTAAARRALGAGQGGVRLDKLAVPGALVPAVPASAPAGDILDALGGTVAGVVVVVSEGHVVGAVTAAELAAASGLAARIPLRA